MNVPTKMRFWSKLISVTVLLILSTWTTTYTVKVNVITNHDTAGKNPQTYIIVNTNHDIDESDLRYQETAK